MTINDCVPRLSFHAQHTRQVPAVVKYGTRQRSTTDSGEIEERLVLSNWSTCYVGSCVDTDVAGAMMVVCLSPHWPRVIGHQVSFVLTRPASRTLVTGRHHQLGWSLRYIADRAWSRFTVVLQHACRAILNTVQPARIHSGSVVF